MGFIRKIVYFAIFIMILALSCAAEPALVHADSRPSVLIAHHLSGSATLLRNLSSEDSVVIGPNGDALIFNREAGLESVKKGLAEIGIGRDLLPGQRDALEAGESNVSPEELKQNVKNDVIADLLNSPSGHASESGRDGAEGDGVRVGSIRIDGKVFGSGNSTGVIQAGDDPTGDSDSGGFFVWVSKVAQGVSEGIKDVGFIPGMTVEGNTRVVPADEAEQMLHPKEPEDGPVYFRTVPDGEGNDALEKVEKNKAIIKQAAQSGVAAPTNPKPEPEKFPVAGSEKSNRSLAAGDEGAAAPIPIDPEASIDTDSGRRSGQFPKPVSDQPDNDATPR